jgi:hypothetical protein
MSNESKAKRKNNRGTHQVANQWAAVPVAVRQNFRMLQLRAKTFIFSRFYGCEIAVSGLFLTLT